MNALAVDLRKVNAGSGISFITPKWATMGQIHAPTLALGFSISEGQVGVQPPFREVRIRPFRRTIGHGVSATVFRRLASDALSEKENSLTPRGRMGSFARHDPRCDCRGAQPTGFRRGTNVRGTNGMETDTPRVPCGLPHAEPGILSRMTRQSVGSFHTKWRTLPDVKTESTLDPLYRGRTAGVRPPTKCIKASSTAAAVVTQTSKYRTPSPFP
jgi:hypothetical protein